MDNDLSVYCQLGSMAVGFQLQQVAHLELLAFQVAAIELVGRHLDGIGVAPPLDRVLREQRRQDLGMIERPGGAPRLAGNPVGLPDRKLEALRRRRQAVRLLVDEIAERLRGYADGPTFYVEKLSEGIGKIACAFFPRPGTPKRWEQPG